VSEIQSSRILARCAAELLRASLGRHDVPIDVEAIRLLLNEGLVEIGQAHVPVLTDSGELAVNRIVMGAFPKEMG
jgi:hypothetical protein